MRQSSQHHTWDAWPGWSTISANDTLGLTLWFTGLPCTGKTTVARLVKNALVVRGYKAEIIDAQVISQWLKLQLPMNEDPHNDRRHSIGYDVFIAYVCALLGRNGIISVTTAISPNQETRAFARQQIQRFVEVYLHCPEELRQKRLEQQKNSPKLDAHLYEVPQHPEINIDTSALPAERSALQLISYLELRGSIAPLWEEQSKEIELSRVKARLQAFGYLE